jgi:protease-4
MALDAEALLDRRRQRRRLIFWRTATIVALAVAVVAVAARFPSLRDWQGTRVARLWIEDIIVGDQLRTDAIDDLAEDGAVAAVVLRIDSPGGTLSGSEELYLALRRLADRKPLVAVIGGVGASGGYMAAIAADRILARDSSITGSIGVILQTMEVTDLLDRLGIKPEAIKSGALKAQPSPFEKLSDQARAATEATVRDSYELFASMVGERRGLSGADLAVVTDGRVFTGRQALKARLIDQIGGEREALQWLAEERGIDEDLPVVDVTWGEPADLLYELSGRVFGKPYSFERLTLDGLVALWHPHP